VAKGIRGIGTGISGLFYWLVLQKGNATGKEAAGKHKSGGCSHDPGFSESYHQPQALKT
jgi:hypothetical protein